MMSVVLGVAACGGAGPSTMRARRIHRDPGDLREMTTLAGSVDGYEVIAPCNDEGLVGIRGQGPVRLPTARPMRVDPSEQVSDEFRRLRARIQDALQPYAVGVGYGLGCRAESTEFSFRIYVRAYRDVDPAITRLGALLNQERRGEDYVILLVTSWS